MYTKKMNLWETSKKRPINLANTILYIENVVKIVKTLKNVHKFIVTFLDETFFLYISINFGHIKHY